MLVLGIETSSPVSSVALADGARVLASRVERGTRGHVEFLMPAVRALCGETGVSLGELTGVAVGLGPGAFTSMRVGIATAKTLAQVLGIPIVGVSSLDALAFAVRTSPTTVCACVDARRGEVYAALYRPGGVHVGDPAVWAPDALARELRARGEDVLFVGDGAHVYAAALGGVGEMAANDRFPTADAIVALAVPAFERRESTPVALVEPLYVRRSDAEIKWEERGVVIERPLRVKVPKRARQV